MSWNILAFESRRGEKFVEEFFKSLDPITIAKGAHAIDLLEKHGPFLGMPHAKRVTKELNELRIRGKQEIRILYTIIGKNMYLLHAFKKQTKKTPHKEISVAEKRILEVDRT